MTEVDIDLEQTTDGQMLIDLVGDRAELLWKIDHPWASDFAEVLVVLFILLSFILFVRCIVEWDQNYPVERDRLTGCHGFTKDAYKRRRRRALYSIAVLAVIFAVVIIGTRYGTAVTWERDLDSTEAQIRSILARHPGWEDLL